MTGFVERAPAQNAGDAREVTQPVVCEHCREREATREQPVHWREPMRLCDLCYRINDLSKPNDWTNDGTYSNSSQKYLEVSAAVAALIRNSAHSLILGDSESVGRLIVAQLAHVHGLAPANEVSADLGRSLDESASRKDNLDG